LFGRLASCPAWGAVWRAGALRRQLGAGLEEGRDCGVLAARGAHVADIAEMVDMVRSLARENVVRGPARRLSVASMESTESVASLADRGGGAAGRVID